MPGNTDLQTTSTDVAQSDVQVNSTITDNSNNGDDLQKQISEALNEPETKVEEPQGTQEPPKPEPKQDNNVNCPEKFKNEDGSVNIEKLAKSYKELEPLLNEKAAWQKERAELLEIKKQLDEFNKQKEEQAIQAGYSSTEDMQQVFEIANLEANEYAKYLPYVENPEEVRQ